MGGRGGPFAALAVLGAAWGFTIPMTKIAVSTGYQPLGLIFWQLVFMLPILGGAMLVRRRRPVLSPRFWGFFLIMALLGTIIPNSVSYRAAVVLPAGIMSMIIAIVPLFALPIAIAMRLERPNLVRLSGILAGAAAVALIIGPDAGLPASATVGIVLFALIAPACYGLESNYLAWRGLSRLDPIQLLFGSTLIALVVVTPLSVASGEWINLAVVWGAPEWAMLASAIGHAAAYTGYVWLIGRAGSVFAAQVAYPVTAFGVIWSMLLLGERYSPWVWAAFAMMMAGVALVRPRAGGAQDAAAAQSD